MNVTSIDATASVLIAAPGPAGQSSQAPRKSHGSVSPAATAALAAHLESASPAATAASDTGGKRAGKGAPSAALAAPSAALAAPITTDFPLLVDKIYTKAEAIAFGQQALEDHGFLVVRGLVSSRLVERGVDAIIDRVKEGLGAHGVSKRGN